MAARRSGVAVDNGSIMCVEAHVFFFVFCDYVFFFFYGAGGCQHAMFENLRFIARLLLLLQWSTEL